MPFLVARVDPDNPQLLIEEITDDPPDPGGFDLRGVKSITDDEAEAWLVAQEETDMDEGDDEGEVEASYEGEEEEAESKRSLLGRK